jgi:hypothetical protein
MAKFPQTATAARPRYHEQVTVHYTASATWYHPTLDSSWPLGSAEEVFTCEHKHKTIPQAEACGRRGAERAARAWQAKAEAEFPRLACRYEVYREERIYPPLGADAGDAWADYSEPGFIVYCASHGTNAGTFRRDASAALATGWECPWAPFVRPLPPPYIPSDIDTPTG